MLAFLLGNTRAATLVWDANSPTPAGYNVYYSSLPDISLHKTNVGLATSFDLGFLSAGRTYTFYVTAYSAEGIESDPSLSVTHAPVAPSEAPVLTSQPLSESVLSGSAVTFSVTATGTGPLTYQWRKNGTEIVGATTATYFISAVQAGDAGFYSVEVSNAAGSVTSTAATLIVLSPPAITAQPVSQSVKVGNSATFSISAIGSAPLSLQWMKGGVNIAGATSLTYSINAVDTSDAGSYSVRVSNPVGSVTSATATLAVLVPPSITTQPASRNVNIGSAISLSVSAEGTAPLSYQWVKNGANIAGATAATYSISSAQAGDAGTYSVKVSNSAGSITSSSATVTVIVAPSITTHPVSQSVNVGSSLTLSATITGTAPLNYQWLKNGVAIAGATTVAYSISTVQASDAGSYSVKVSNSAGTVTSSAAIVSVIAPPEITVQPLSQSVNARASLTLSVSAAGSAPLSYQWLKYGVNIPGATASTFLINSVTSEDSGSYSVRVSNPAGSVNSSAALVTVISPPLFTSQPSSQTINEGSTLTLAAGVSGTLPLSYQWIKNGSAIAGATAQTYVITPVEAGSAGSYTLRVTNAAGSATSSPAVVTVVSPPTIVQQPSSQTVNNGSSISLQVQATGSAPLVYRWRKDGLLISGASASIYSIVSAETQHSGVYVVEVSNAAGSVTSQSAILTVSLPGAPTIVGQSADVQVAVGLPISLTVEVTGTGPFSYQWFKNGSPISGATGSSYQVASSVSGDAGTYNVRVSNLGGSTLSQSIHVTVGTPPTIVRQPASQSAEAGSSVTFSVEAAGSPPLSYRWTHNGSVIPGATSSTLTIGSARTSDAGSYHVEISNTAGKILSNPATLTITGEPVIVQQPQSRTLAYGSRLSVSVQATGAAPLNYRWIKDGSYLPNATGSNFIVEDANLTDSGSYSVEVSNLAGLVTSQAANITVLPANPPVITRQPSGGSVEIGASISLTVEAAGTGTLSYQWLKNGSLLAGATSPTFSVSNAQVSNGGRYTVQVNNDGGYVLSEEVVVVVGTAPSIIQQPLGQTAGEGTRVTLTVEAAGSSPLSYRWMKEGIDVAGATTATYTIIGLTSDDGGTYTVEVANPVGSVISLPAIVTVLLENQTNSTPDIAPLITLQPESKSADAGTSVSFTVEATGTGPFSFRWSLNGNFIPNGTNSTLTLSSVRAADAGTYSVKITGPGGTAVSQPATLIVTGAPVVVTPPQSQSISVGNPLFLTVQVGGIAPFSYRWIKSGAYIPNATSSTFAIAAVQSGDAGTYSVEVSNAAGMIVSPPASITVSPTSSGSGSQGAKPPVITRQPASLTIDVRSPASFSIEATSTEALTYRWIRNGSYITGVTSSLLSIPSVTLADAGTYLIEVSNSGGTVISQPATLTVIGAPVIIVQPQSQSIAAGSAMTLSVEVNGVAPFTYRWIKGGAYISDATSRTLTVSAVQLADAGNYAVEVSNGAGQVVSQTATITVTGSGSGSNPSGAAPVITRQPISQTMEVGLTATFSVEATGSALRYRWIRSGSYIPGATASMLNIPSIALSDAGSYSVEISNDGGAVISQPASLTVVGAPAILSQPQSQTLIFGASLTLSVEVSGAAPMSYRWIKNGVYIPGATSKALFLSNVKYSDAGGYSVQVQNAAGQTLSHTATITILSGGSGSSPSSDPSPTITRHPTSQTIDVGSSATFSVEAVSANALSYVWIRNGAYISGATDSTLVIPSVGLADAGTYTVEVSTIEGMVLSQPATLKVVGAPVILAQPQSQTVTAGQPLSLSVEASGAALVIYRWIKGGAFIPGATNKTFTIAATQLSDNGIYAVQVSNGAGHVVSQTAAINVSSAGNGSTEPTHTMPVITRQPASQTVTVGAYAAFSVQATATSPLSYRWIRNGAYIPGATAPDLVFSAAAVANAGTYAVEVSSSVGTVVSQPATLNVGGAPVILTHPQNTTVTIGDRLTLSVEAGGAVPMIFRWIKGGVYIPGVTNRVLIIPAVQMSDAGNYSVQIENGAGQVVSQVAVVVINGAPVITQHPTSQSVQIGSPLLLNVNVQGAAPFTYRWVKGGAYISGATSSTYQIPSVRQQDGGSYSAEVSNAAGRVVSQPAVINITDQIVETKLDVSVTGSTTKTVRLTLSGAPGTYEVQHTTNLGAAPWQVVVRTNISATTPISIPVGTANQGFFKTVRVQN